MTQNQTERVLIGVREAARMLGICQRSVYALLASGELPSVKIGARRMFRPEALREWAARQESFDPPQGRQGRRRKTDGQQGGQQDDQSAQRGKARGGQQHE